MPKKQYKLEAKVWRYPALIAWHFVTIPHKQAVEIQLLFGSKQKGWGSLPVEVIIGKTRWNTSIFRHRESNSYILPLKSDVRKKEDIYEGDVVNFTLFL